VSHASPARGTGWKAKLTAELIDYWIVVLYLACFFGVFTWYRRLILAEYQIGYLHYGVSVVEALVLAKVILIGDVLRLGRGLDDKPLIVPTLYKAVVFSLWVGCLASSSIRSADGSAGTAGGEG
jgi:hypothetical protein